MASLHIVVQLDSLQHGDGQFHFKALMLTYCLTTSLYLWIWASWRCLRLSPLTDCGLTHHAFCGISRAGWFNKHSGLYLSFSPLYCNYARTFVLINLVALNDHSPLKLQYSLDIITRRKRLGYVCPAANLSWLRLTIVSPRSFLCS